MKKKNKPSNPFNIPKFVAPSVCNSALEVISVDPINNTFDAKVYDPLDVSDQAHGDILTFQSDTVWIPVDLAPVLFKTAA